MGLMPTRARWSLPAAVREMSARHWSRGNCATGLDEAAAKATGLDEAELTRRPVASWPSGSWLGFECGGPITRSNWATPLDETELENPPSAKPPP